MAAAAAIPAITNAVSSIGKLLFAQHTARLKGATNENAALDQVIPAWDLDVQYVADVFNKGQATAPDCIAALQTIDAQVYQYLKQHVGAAGTSWNVGALGNAINPEYHADCNKACTAGCCVYNNDLRPSIYGRNNGGALLNFGLIQAIQQGHGTVKILEVFAPPNSAYGNYSRPAYSITVLKPKIAATATVQGILNQVLGEPGAGIALPATIGTAPQVSGGTPFGGGGYAPTGSEPLSPGNNLGGFTLLAAIFLAVILILTRAAK